MKQLGAEHVMVVHSKDGLDEISLASSTYVAELKDGEITEWELTPESVGIESQTLTGLIVENSAESLSLIKDALGKNKSDYLFLRFLFLICKNNLQHSVENN